MAKLRRDWPDKHDCNWILQGLYEKIEEYSDELDRFIGDFNPNHVHTLGMIAVQIVAECDKILQRYPPNTGVGFNIVDIKSNAAQIINAVHEKMGPGQRYAIHTGQSYSVDRISYEFNAVNSFVRKFIEAHEKIQAGRRREPQAMEEISEERRYSQRDLEDLEDMEQASIYYKPKPKKGLFRKIWESIFG